MSDRTVKAVQALAQPLADILGEAKQVMDARHFSDLHHAFENGQAGIRYQIDIRRESVSVAAVVDDGVNGATIPLFTSHPPAEGQR